MPPRKTKEAAGSPAKKTKAPKAKKDPNAPKKPSGAYIFFCNDKRGEVKKANPEYGVAQIGKELGAMWKDVTEKDKQKYFDQASKDKERYTKEAAAYKSKQGDTKEEEEETAGEISGFDETEEEAYSDKTSKALRCSRGCRYYTPYDHNRRQVECRFANLVEEEVAGHLHENISNEKDTQCRQILCPSQIELVLQSRQSSGSDIVAIKIVHQVHDDKHW